MSQQPPQYQYERPRSNGLGIAGFVVSLVAIFTGGILSPIALLLSFIALFRRPRGFAIAGFIIGGLGTLFLALVLSFFGILGFSCFNISKPIIATANAHTQASQKIQEYANTHGGAIPNDVDGEALIAPYPDGWGHPMRYRSAGRTFEITSAGADGIFDTQDDLNFK